jgi:DNA ligase-1
MSEPASITLREVIRIWEQLETVSDESARIRLIIKLIPYLLTEAGNILLFALLGKSAKKIYTPDDLERLYLDYSETDELLYQASVATVGDVGEAIALLAGNPDNQGDLIEISAWAHRLPRPRTPDDRLDYLILEAWNHYPPSALYYFHRFIMGKALIPSQLYPLTQALATAFEKSPSACLAFLQNDYDWLNEGAEHLHRFIQETEAALILPPFSAWMADNQDETPAYISTPIPTGIRLRMGVTNGLPFIQSEQKALPVGNSKPFFPYTLLDNLPDGVVLEGILSVSDENGNLLAPKQWQNDLPKKNGWQKLSEKYITAFIIYDLLYKDGQTVWMQPYSTRKKNLIRLLSDLGYDNSVSQTTETVLIPDLPYGATAYLLPPKRTTLLAVLLYATRTTGSRHDEYTFALPNEDQLIPIGKVQSNLSEEEQMEIEQYIRKHTKERFGPMRSLTPMLVFELNYRSVHPSKRHKSGIVIHELQIAAWRRDLDVSEIDSFKRLLEK